MTQSGPPSLSHSVTPGLVYEVRMRVTTSADHIVVAEAALQFTDAQGEATDLRLLTDVQYVPHLMPLQLTALPQHIPADIRNVVGLETRLFIAPPDSSMVQVSTDADVVTLEHCSITALSINWITEGQAVAEAVDEAGKARISALKQHLPKATIPKKIRDLIRRVPQDQISAITAQFRPAGNWGPVIKNLASQEETADLEERVKRLGMARSEDIRIGFVGHPRTFDRLRCLGDTFWLREDNFADQLEMLSPEIVIVETAPESGPGDWNYAFSALNGELPDLGQALCDALCAKNIPLHLYVSDTPAVRDTWRDMLEIADRVLIAGNPDVWGKTPPKGAVFLPRATEPAAIPAALTHPRVPELMLVPVGSDIFQFPEFAELVKASSLQDTLIAEFHYGFGPRALAPRLAPRSIRCLPDLSYQQQGYVLRNATLVLLNGQSLRSDGDMKDLVLDAITAGAIPVICEPTNLSGPLFDLIPRVRDAQDLITLQHRMRNVWWRERSWRKLYRYVMRHHRLTRDHRIMLLGRDPCPDDFDTPRMSVVLATKRPHLLQKSLQTFRDQTWPDKELVLVLNMSEMPVDMPPLRDNEKAFLVPEHDSIGRALNLGINTCTGQVWCKMDDDDFYSRTYLEEYAHHYHATQADSLGRQAAFFYFAGSNESVGRLHLLDRCGRKFHSGHFSSGAALSGRHTSGLPEFSNTKRNSADSEWLRVVCQAGARIFCYDSTSLVVFRDADESRHTWKMSGRSDMMQRLDILSTGNIHRRLDSV